MNINMKQSRLKLTLPIPIKRVLGKLGKDIKNARLRRRISTQMMADRAFISRTTLNKVEKGDASVAMGIYATVLFILGLTERLNNLADFQFDSVGRTLEEELLPKRIRQSKKNE
jgi:transcriptional regulator with XRE-family HTH domain